MKILHIESGRHLYGGPRQVLLLTAGLRAAGHENVLACPSGSAIAGVASDAEVIEMPMRGDLDVALVPRLRRLLGAVRPDIVHLHSRRGADWLGALAMRGRVPAVLSRRVDNPEPAIARLKYAMVDRIIGISARICDELRRRGVPAGKVVCVPSAVPPAQPFTRDREWLGARFGIAADRYVIGVIAQLIKRKGHRYLFEALSGLAERHRHLHVLVLGRGPQEQALRAQVAAADLGARVTFAGFRDDLDRLLPNLDLVVHPALLEGLGIAVLQAAQAALPIVACRAGGVPEIIEHGVTGLLVPPADSTALRSAVDRLMSDPAEADALGKAGARRVAERFSPAAMVAGNLAVYESLLATR